MHCEDLFGFSLKIQPLGRQGVSHQLCSVLRIFGSRDYNHVETFRPPGALSIQWQTNFLWLRTMAGS